jgi:hypothetical protein
MQIGLIFNLQTERTGASTHRNLTPGASNPRASRQLGVWGRCKTERGDREDRDGVLTSGGGRRHRPDFAVNSGGSLRFGSGFSRHGGGPLLQGGGGVRLRRRAAARRG